MTATRNPARIQPNTAPAQPDWPEASKSDANTCDDVNDDGVDHDDNGVDDDDDDDGDDDVDDDGDKEVGGGEGRRRLSST